MRNATPYARGREPIAREPEVAHLMTVRGSRVNLT